jgi:hypothetical protein
MAKKIKSLEEIRPNIFEALKRAYVKRGFVRMPRRISRSRPALAANDDQSAKSKDAQPKEPGETYPEKVAVGESDSDIEGEGRKKSLEKLGSADSKSAGGPETLPELTEKSLDVLYEATTVFPFTLFPDTITLDREKLTIAERFFWRTARITSVPVGEIMSAEANVGPFFGALHLTFRFFTNNERSISFLPRRDAIEMQRLIHGYIIAHRREIDVSSVSKDKLIEMLTELGQGATD